MGTIVTIRIVPEGPKSADAMDRAFEWFHEIESCCTRFDPESELMELCRTVGSSVEVSPLLFEAIQFALNVAEETKGAFDPTLGHRVESAGFNREHRAGETVRTSLTPPADVSWRDVIVDEKKQTVTLRRPLLLDLGAVAKGLALDAAARELAPLRHFAIDAGGDLYLGGRNEKGEPWSVGIRNPHKPDELLCSVRISDKAVCTSGNYERPGHLMDPRSSENEPLAASATVISEIAMLADAVSTAAFILGPKAGIDLLHSLGVEGLIIASDLTRHQTKGFPRVQ